MKMLRELDRNRRFTSCTIGGLIIDRLTRWQKLFLTLAEREREIYAAPLLSYDMRMQLGSRAIHGGIKLKPTLDEILCGRVGV